MKSPVWTKSYEGRRSFIGGSDARIIMGNDEAALIRLWQEKRGEAQPEDLSSNLIVQLGAATGTNAILVGTSRMSSAKSSIPPFPGWRQRSNGIVEGTEAVFEAKFMLPWSFSEEAAAKSTWPKSSTTCGSPT